MNNVHFAIPEIYGDSLSYYELLRKLVNKTNELIENYNTVPEQISEEVKKLDAYSVFTTALNWLIHSIATDNTKSKDAVRQYKKHDLLYATFNDTVNLYEAITDFTNVFLTELKVDENIREVNISELLIELRTLIDTNKNNIESVTAVANQNSEEIATMNVAITNAENKNTEQDNELSTLRTMISSPYNFKGEVASISALPASGEVNDTYYVQDVKYKVTWTGSAWVQSSLSEADYQTQLSELKSDITNIHNGRELKSFLSNQGYVHGNGVIVEHIGTWRYSDFIPIDNNNKITYTAWGSNNTSATQVNNVGFYTNEKIFIGALRADDGVIDTVYSKTSKIPANASYMVICDNTKNTSTFLSYNESQVPNIAFKDFAKNVVNHGYVNTDGVVVPITEGNWLYSDLIPTDGYNSIEYSLNVNNSVSAIVLYDSYENVISKLITDNSQLELVNGKISISNASYIRLCSYIDVNLNCIGYVSYLHADHPYNEAHYQNLVNKPYDFKGKTALFYGDSITQGFTSGNSFTQNGYPKLFSEAVNMSYTNYGVGGSCFSHKYNGVATIVSKITETPIDTLQNADYIFIAGGVNDWQTGVTDKQLISALDTLNQFLANNNLVDKVIYITPINEAGKKPSVKPKQSLQNVRNIITRKSIEVGASVIQGYLFPFPTETDDSQYISEMYGDKLHPSELGYRVYAKSLLTALM